MATAETITLDGNTYTVLVQGWQPFRSKGERVTLTSTGKHDIVYPAVAQQGWNLVLKCTYEQLLSLMGSFSRKAAVSYTPSVPIPRVVRTVGGTDRNITYEPWTAEFTAPRTATITRIDFYVQKKGTVAGTIEAEIWSNSSGEPDTTQGSSTAINATDISTTAGWQTFTFSTGVSITRDTIYHVGMDFSAAYMSGSPDASNCIVWQGEYDATAGIGDMAAYYNAAWIQDSEIYMTYRLFSTSDDVYLVGELAPSTLVPILDGDNALYHVPIRLVLKNV
tara:strand:+ start:9407 stop:10240 length:834 start_codon:yes stop_codon:yes gene_type:complete